MIFKDLLLHECAINNKPIVKSKTFLLLTNTSVHSNFTDKSAVQFLFKNIDLIVLCTLIYNIAAISSSK